MLSAWLPGKDGGRGGDRHGVSDGGQVEEQVQALVCAASEATGLHLLRLGTSAEASEIRDTAVAQPLIVLVSLASAMYRGLLPEQGSVAAETKVDQIAPEHGAGDVVAGHSLGALTALALAGVLTPVETVMLAAKRGDAMAACCQANEPGGMCALLGGDRAEVLAAIETAGLCAANVNGSSQVVAAGPVSALAGLKAPGGARVVRLEVSGAFHSPAMVAAAPVLEKVVAGLPERVLRRAVVDEATGEVHQAGEPGASLLRGLAEHLTAPVRWDLVQESLLELGVSEAVELAPAGALAGFARRDLPGVTVIRLR
ncbi:ACP S-malonyltransferase [Actinomyces trachealis]|uniref:ACP S-malonyltransferase n=1 Tax=Actinomyces trachealis TaxID=2763540 RepID=UPI001892C75D|nr:ACP S-malonyltransferase [Actinomyces trachealis]